MNLLRMSLQIVSLSLILWSTVAAGAESRRHDWGSAALTEDTGCDIVFVMSDEYNRPTVVFAEPSRNHRPCTLNFGPSGTILTSRGVLLHADHRRSQQGEGRFSPACIGNSKLELKNGGNLLFFENGCTLKTYHLTLTSIN